MTEPKNGEKRLVSIVGLIIWRWGVAAAVGIGAYAGLWVKANVPSREQFQALTAQVQSLREEMIRAEKIKDILDELKRRQERTEERIGELERKSTPFRPPPLRQ